MKRIKEYCKLHKLKLECVMNEHFIASKVIPIRAGMELNNAMNGFSNMNINTVGKKRIFSKFKLYPDQDIVDMGIIESKFIH